MKISRYRLYSYIFGFTIGISSVNYLFISFVLYWIVYLFLIYLYMFFIYSGYLFFVF